MTVGNIFDANDDDVNFYTTNQVIQVEQLDHMVNIIITSDSNTYTGNDISSNDEHVQSESTNTSV